MKTKNILPVLALAALTITGALAFKSGDTTPAAAKSTSVAGSGFAVIELFTSEGCSSCPPADALVSKIVKEDKDKPVYVLGFHVDYWNHLGWTDEFSKAEYSARQRQYARYLHADTYTPQIVVNGKKEFVGSDEGSLRNAIQASLQKPTIEVAALSDVHFTGSMLSLQYHTSSSANRALLIAFVEKNAQSHVKAGENSGRVLNHVNIVKDLNTLNLRDASGTDNVKLPAGFNEQNWEVVGFIQNTSTGEIISAQKVVTSAI